MLFVAVSATAACLPRGEAPAGRQLIADRAASLGALVPPNGDGVLRILLLRPAAADSTGSDLFVVSIDADGQQSPERLLISDINTEDGVGCSWKVAPCSFDARGRVFVYRNSPVSATPGDFGPPPVWVDPISGDIQEAPLTQIWSPSDLRWAVVQQPDRTNANPPPPATATLTEADGRTTTVQLASSDPTSGGYWFPRFVGEDFVYLDPQGEVMDIPPSGVPQQLAKGVTGFTASPTPDGPLLILSRATTTSSVTQMSIRDPVTGQETQLPFPGPATIGLSPDGQWLLHIDDGPSASRYTLFNYHSGASQTLDFPPGVEAWWRPGHDEVWFNSPGDAPRISAVTPGGPSVTVDGVYLSGFSSSGTYWFGTQDPTVDPPIQEVGLADDPAGPRVPYNPPGTYVDKQEELPDGRILASVFAKDQQRTDVITVDPRTGDRQLLAERGVLAAVGQTRFIGMFHFQGGRGDLTAVDLTSGHPTVLAPEFAVTAFAEPQGTDLVAPGTRVVYQFQARTASPYDGVWLVDCP
ncbi:MAG TPA: hypothetical protein VHO67_03425 [Polyangia bacterium]|nr:hypothetical protein [Polyangia bacterium]